MCKFIGKSNEQIIFKLNKSETVKTSNFTCQSKSFISIFFTFQVSACKLLPFSCHDLANGTYSQTANWKLCSATLPSALKRTVTGPDQIPYWVRKEHTEISRFLSPKSGISQSLLSVCHHRGSKQLSPPTPSPKWVFLRHMVIIVALIYLLFSLMPVIARAMRKLCSTAMPVRPLKATSAPDSLPTEKVETVPILSLLPIQHRINSYFCG